MATDIDMEEKKQFDDYTPTELLNVMLFTIVTYLHLQNVLPQAGNRAAVLPGCDYIKVTKNDHLIGMEQKFTVHLNDKLVAINDNLDEKGCLMMKYGYSEQIDTLFYWTTAMRTIHFSSKNQR